MYLQITTKCNMKCSHCCYSCNKNGKHMTRSTWEEAIRYAADHDEVISIGGGEPTLHPDFFEILRRCLWNFEYVWMATNGSRTKTMRRLAKILDLEDYSNDYNYEGIIPKSDDQFCVALSLDCFHDPINSAVESYWRRQADWRKGNYEIRDVTRNLSGISAQGRAKRFGYGEVTNCCCSTLIIRPDGKIKPCGCLESPVIGSIWGGIEHKWEDYIENNESYRDTGCYCADKWKFPKD